MRVLLAHEFYRTSAPSGEDAVFLNEKQLLENDGMEIFCYEKHNDHIDDSTWSKKVNLAISSTWSKKSYQEISGFIQKYKPDIAHFHNTFPMISPSAYFACQRHGVPVVQTLHNYRLVCPNAMLIRNQQPCEKCLNGNLIPSLVHRCYRNSLAATVSLAGIVTRNRLNGSYKNNVDRYIALTDFAKRKLVQGGLPEAKIAVKPNFLPAPPEAGTGSGNYATYIGRLSEEKGVRILLKAWRNIKQIKLKILGDGPLRQELQHYAHDHQIDAEFLGFRGKQDILEFVKNAQFQVVPSQWYEGFPMVILEALACGTPVVASRIGSLTEIVRDQHLGVLFNPGDSNDLIDKISWLTSNKETLSQLRQHARSEFIQKYTAEKNLQLIKQIYHQTMANRGTDHGLFNA